MVSIFCFDEFSLFIERWANEKIGIARDSPSEVIKIGADLQKKNIDSVAIHGRQKSVERIATYHRYLDCETNYLIASLAFLSGMTLVRTYLAICDGTEAVMKSSHFRGLQLVVNLETEERGYCFLIDSPLTSGIDRQQILTT
jgi:superfamily II DNA/RNA helicase